MSNIPLLNDDQDEIRQSLSIQEIHIALHFLKKRFRKYSVSEIVQALNDYIIQKETSSIGIPLIRASNMAVSHVRQGLFLSHRSRPQIQEDRITKSEQIKLVAKLYTQSGINYSLAKFFYPNMTQKDYKNNLQLIAAQTLNCIESYLSYECSIQVERLSTAQKKSARQKLVNLRDWMGKINPQEMKTYMLFVERFYLNENIQIEYKQAIELYKVILQSVKGPQVDVANQNHTNRGLRQQLTISSVNQQKSLSKEEENAIILLFKQVCSVQKVSDAMCQKYGYNIKWSIHSVKNILKKIYKASLKKLVQTANIYLKKQVNLWFGYGDDDVMALLEYENSLQTKIVLLDFYILKKITQLKLKQFVKKVNQFYRKQYQRQGVINETIPEELISLPTLIIDEKPIQVIDLVDKQKSVPKRQSCKVQTQQKQNRSMRKKRNWMEVVQLDQSLREEQTYLFPRNINKKEKEANENTDIQDEQPRRNRERQIFGPKKSIQKKNQVKSKDIKDNLKEKTDVKMDLNKQKMKQEQQALQKQNQKKILTQAQIKKQSALIKIQKKQKINSSFDSIQSEPVKLSFYNKPESSKGRRFDSQLKARFKRKLAHQQNEDKMQLQN